MAYLNKVFLMGNLGKDPEIRTFQSGSKCATFSLATSKRYRDQNGEQKEQTQWHTVRVMGRSADTIGQLGIRKGTQMMVEGELTYRSWDDPSTGLKRYATEVVAFTFQLLGPRPQAGNAAGASTAYDYGAATRQRTDQPGQQGDTAPQGDWAQPSQAELDDLPF